MQRHRRRKWCREENRLLLVSNPLSARNASSLTARQLQRRAWLRYVPSCRTTSGAHPPSPQPVPSKPLTLHTHPIWRQVRQSVAQLDAQGHSAPSLVVVLVGGHPASKAYVAKKLQAATACGLTARVEALDDTVSTNGLLDVVHNLNMDDGVHGVIVQLPLPAHIEPAQITNAVAHAKDVDGCVHLHHASCSAALIHLSHLASHLASPS